MSHKMSWIEQKFAIAFMLCIPFKIISYFRSHIHCVLLCLFLSLVIVFMAVGVVRLFSTSEIYTKKKQKKNICTHKNFLSLLFPAVWCHWADSASICFFVVVVFIVFVPCSYWFSSTYLVVIVWMHRLCLLHPHTPVVQIVVMLHLNYDLTLQI